jgi:hypothetical protein
MSDRSGAVRRYLESRKNIAGMAIGALADRLAEQVPDAQLLRAEDLTRELRHRRET